MPRQTLEKAGFARVGHVMLSDPSTFGITFDLTPEAEWWVCCLYAFRVGGNVVRIGKTEGVLRQRMADWKRDVTNGLRGRFPKGGTSRDEANRWQEFLGSRRRGELLAKRILPPDKVALRSQERELVTEYDPILNHEPRRRR
jgi:hypothetical protein